MRKFYTKDCPDHMTIATWLKEHTDWIQLANKVKPKNQHPEMICMKTNIDCQELSNDINEARSLYGDYGWKYSDGESIEYTGFSLVYNKTHQDNLHQHQSTLGTPKNKRNEYFWSSVQHHNKLKNSYFDSYSFNEPTEASQHKSLGGLLQKIKRTKIRSRLSVIKGKYEQSINRDSWHRDEIIFENLRILVPTQTVETYMLELENKQPVHLQTGWSYTWDTHIPHRVYNTEVNNSERIHIVIGTSPWWDYLPEENAWIQNEFYGNKHPFDMLVDGDIIEGFEYDENKKVY